jgi:ubiquinone/menaquinone biosynthesis C-methylase UbiE
VAAWYDRLVGEAGSDYHRNVIIPGALRLLGPAGGLRIIDIACGQGVFCRELARQGAAAVLGVDASSRLIDAARRHGSAPGVRYAVGDARKLDPLADGAFDAAVCLMALQDIDDVPAVFAEMARALRPAGRAVVVMMHPCFRVPRQSTWGWDEQKKLQYRRIDAYATPNAIPIATHPGSEPGQHTTFFHRPLADYINAMAAAGMAVTACEELLSHRVSEPGGRSRGENRARREFPLFLAMRAVKLVPPAQAARP